MNMMNELKRRRFELGFTQYDIEKLTGIRQSCISLIENGYREPNEEEKKRLEKILRIDN